MAVWISVNIGHSDENPSLVPVVKNGFSQALSNHDIALMKHWVGAKSLEFTGKYILMKSFFAAKRRFILRCFVFLCWILLLTWCPWAGIFSYFLGFRLEMTIVLCHTGKMNKADLVDLPPLHLTKHRVVLGLDHQWLMLKLCSGDAVAYSELGD